MTRASEVRYLTGEMQGRWVLLILPTVEVIWPGLVWRGISC